MESDRVSVMIEEWYKKAEITHNTWLLGPQILRPHDLVVPDN
jgi:hypothetical protein